MRVEVNGIVLATGYYDTTTERYSCCDSRRCVCVTARAECSYCGEANCSRPHDCQGCATGDAVSQCDDKHFACADCQWTVGEGDNVFVRCRACDAQADDYEAQAAELGEP